MPGYDLGFTVFGRLEEEVKYFDSFCRHEDHKVTEAPLAKTAACQLKNDEFDMSKE